VVRDQGLTVLVVSWVNPDARLARKSFEEYMRDGVLKALDIVKEATGESKAHTIGYASAARWLAVTLAHLAAKGRRAGDVGDPVRRQVDFTYGGRLEGFVDEERLAALERRMDEQGYLEGSKMASAFNMLRSNELIWPYVVGNYLMASRRSPSTCCTGIPIRPACRPRTTRFYLRNCYLKNNLSRGEMVIAGEPVDLGRSPSDLHLATREDHIAPAKSVFLGSKFPRRAGQVRAGGLRPHCRRGQSAGQAEIPIFGPRPAQRKPRRLARQGRGTSGLVVAGLAGLDQGEGRGRVAARAPGGGKLAPIEDAPGSYVKTRD